MVLRSKNNVLAISTNASNKVAYLKVALYILSYKQISKRSD